MCIKSAALPNITGSFGNIYYQNATGAFTKGAGSQYGHADAMYADSIIQFSASNSNAIYGASTTVQPPALALIPQIKF